MWERFYALNYTWEIIYHLCERETEDAVWKGHEYPRTVSAFLRWLLAYGDTKLEELLHWKELNILACTACTVPAREGWDAPAVQMNLLGTLSSIFLQWKSYSTMCMVENSCLPPHTRKKKNMSVEVVLFSLSFSRKEHTYWLSKTKWSALRTDIWITLNRPNIPLCS